MVNSEEPILGAHAFRDAGRSLAEAVREVDDPSTIYEVLGYTSSALAALTQTLHHLGAFHDSLAHRGSGAEGIPRAARITVNTVAWELHRAAEVIRQVASGIDRAHELEGDLERTSRAHADALSTVRSTR